MPKVFSNFWRKYVRSCRSKTDWHCRFFLCLPGKPMYHFLGNCGCFFRGKVEWKSTATCLRCVDFFEQNHHGNNIGKPQQHDRVWLSQIGSLQNYLRRRLKSHLLQTFLDFQCKFALWYFKLVGAQISNVEKMAVFCVSEEFFTSGIFLISKISMF